jgi:hypothetical protein
MGNWQDTWPWRPGEDDPRKRVVVITGDFGIMYCRALEQEGGSYVSLDRPTLRAGVEYRMQVLERREDNLGGCWHKPVNHFFAQHTENGITRRVEWKEGERWVYALKYESSTDVGMVEVGWVMVQDHYSKPGVFVFRNDVNYEPALCSDRLVELLCRDDPEVALFGTPMTSVAELLREAGIPEDVERVPLDAGEPVSRL